MIKRRDGKKLLREENTELHRQIDEWVEKVSGVNGVLMDLFYDGVIKTKMISGETDEVVTAINEMATLIKELQKERLEDVI